ncbi:MAG: hypothetical protein FJX76_11375 [Armatimonadetes bacterium]|nr:hypothetical protein [Armatimonadota bacterium]
MQILRKVRPLLLALVLVATAMGWVVAQEAGGVKVLVDKDHNALITMQDESSGSGGGTFNAGIDFAPALATFNTEVDLKDAVGAQGGAVSLYSELSDKNMLLVGDFKVPLPPEANATVTADARGSTTNNVGHVEVKADFSVPNPKGGQEPLTGLTVSGSSNTDYHKANLKLNFNANAAGVQEKLPVKTAKLTIAETGTGADVVTDITLDAAVAANSEPGKQIAAMKGQENRIVDGIKGQLANVPGLTVEVVEVTRLEAKDDTANFAIHIKIKGWRETLNSFAGMMLGRIPDVDPAVMRDSLKSMLALQLDKVNLDVKVDAASVSGSLEIGASNMDQFLQGYMKVMGVVQEQTMKEQLEKAQGNKGAEMAARWGAAIQKQAADWNAKSIVAMISAKATVDQSFNVTVDLKDGKVTGKGEIKSDTSNMDAVMANMKQAGLPSFDRVGFLANVKTEGGNASGSIYASSQGDLIGAVKQLAVQPAMADPELKATAEVINGITLKDSKMTGELKDQKLHLSGYLETSDLTPAAKAALKQIDPNLTGTPDGARIDVKAADNKTTTNLSIRFKEFMTGKAEGDIKTAVGGLVGGQNVTVTMNADAGQVALQPALQKPTIAMPGALAQVKTTAESTLFAGGGLPGLPGGGGKTGTIIAIVVGALVLIGIAMAATKKKA